MITLQDTGGCRVLPKLHDNKNNKQKRLCAVPQANTKKSGRKNRHNNHGHTTLFASADIFIGALVLPQTEAFP